jgi:hypothetical protein
VARHRRPPRPHRPAPSRRINQACQGLGKGRRVARRHFHGGIVGGGLGGGATGRAQDRQAARQRLGQHHAVALEERGHHEEVGAGIGLGQRGVRDGAEKVDPPAQIRGRDRGDEVARRLRCAVGRADDGQSPVAPAQAGEGFDKDAVALARDDRAHGQKVQGLILRRARGAWRRIDAGQRDVDARLGDAEIGDQQPLGRRAGRHHRTRIAQRRGLAGEQSLSGLRRMTRLQPERVMDEGDDASGETRCDPFGKGAIGQPVDQQHIVIGLREDRAAGRGQVILRWKREGARQGDVLGRDAHRAPFRQQPPVVAVAARRQVDVAGDGEGDRAHASAPS